MFNKGYRFGHSLVNKHTKEKYKGENFRALGENLCNLSGWDREEWLTGFAEGMKSHYPYSDAVFYEHVYKITRVRQLKEIG
jgi:hypothetical protein